MSTYGDFSSLLQLGVGIGIGLAVFRAPVDLRTAYIDRVLNSEILALRGQGATEFRKQKRIALMTLRLRFLDVRRTLETFQLPFMIAAGVGAFVNLMCLIGVAYYADENVPAGRAHFFVFVSSIYFMLILAGLEVLARWHLKPLMNKLAEIRISRPAAPHH